MSSKMIFVNLPVTDLRRSRKFYEALGWTVNDDFTDDNAACFAIDDNICLMLLTDSHFGTFVERPVDVIPERAHATYALALGSAEEVDRLAEAAVAAGGFEEFNPDKKRQEAQVGMQNRTFIDPDGHQWEAFWMDYQALQ